MLEPTIQIKRSSAVLRGDRNLVLARPFQPMGNERVLKICSRVMALSEADVARLLEDILAEFGERHRDIRGVFRRRFEAVKASVRLDSKSDAKISEQRELLLGAYFTHEYSIEGAALFNPSIVPHPDQSNLPAGSLRFILSLRATGEGHISSITFRSGVVDAGNQISFEPSSRYRVEPGIVNAARRSGAIEDTSSALIAKEARSSAQSNHQVQFDVRSSLSERVLFPMTRAQSNGIEDARFVLFDDGDERTYYATYTANDGQRIQPELVQTSDFLRFNFIALEGSAVRNKGMALFPRKIQGRYAMLGRQDGENLYLLLSDSINSWCTSELILEPEFAWEFAQLGNCGSPIETEAGWLVISHSVGPMRKYCLGAFLLDHADPAKVVGRLRTPLLEADANERDGYVPNVVYSCGSILHGRELILPYGVSDCETRFATVSLDELLAAMS